MTRTEEKVIPYIPGDGIGKEIWEASQAVFDAALQKAYNGDKKIIWQEILAGEKAFNQKIGLHVAETVIHVGREAYALRAFLLEARSQNGDHALAAYNSHVKVLVVGLRRTESGGIGGTEVEVVGGVETYVEAGGDYGVVDE